MEARIIPMTDEHILKGCRKNERNSQRLLYERYYESLSYTCYRYLRDQSLVEDLVHEGFMKIFKNIKKYNGTGSLEGWMKRVMVNTCLDFLRKENRRPREVDLSAVGTYEVDEDMIAQLQADYIMEVVGQLPSVLRTVFNLNVIEGYPHKEIAKLIQVKESTSRAYLTEAKKLIRKKLKTAGITAERRAQNG